MSGAITTPLSPFAKDKTDCTYSSPRWPRVGKLPTSLINHQYIPSSASIRAFCAAAGLPGNNPVYKGITEIVAVLEATL
jgi:hypothetical protein